MNDTNNLPETVEAAIAELLHAQLLLGVATAKRRPTADAPEVLAASKALVAVCDAVRAALAQQPAAIGEPVARWYCLSRDGAAILCVDEEDALEVAAENFAGRPQNGPYRAAQMAEVRPHPAPARPLTWAEAPRRTEWGAGMMEALIALGTDETLRLYANQDAVPMVNALLSAHPAPARVPLTNKQRTAGASAWAAAWADPDLSPADKAAAVYMAMLTAADITAKEAL